MVASFKSLFKVNTYNWHFHILILMDMFLF